MLEKNKNYLVLHAIVFVWGFTGILGKLIHLDALVIVWYRMFIAFLSLYLFLRFTGKKLEFTSRSLLYKTIGVGVIVALHWILFYESIQMSTVSLGILCLSTTTLHVSWLEPIVMKKKFSWIEFSMGLLVIGGIVIVSEDFNTSEIKALFIGLTAALMAAMFSVFNAKLSEKVSSSSITVMEMFVGFLFLSVLVFFSGKMSPDYLTMTWSDFLWLIFLGVVCTSLAFMVMIEVVKKLGAFTVSLSINFEPIYTMILAAIILHEHELLSWKFYLGAVLIIVVVLSNAIFKSKGWIKRS